MREVKRRQPKTPWDEGGWFSVYRNDRHGAFVVCPDCNEVVELEPNDIAPDGVVSSKVVFRCDHFSQGTKILDWDN